MKLLSKLLVFIIVILVWIIVIPVYFLEAFDSSLKEVKAVMKQKFKKIDDK